MPRYASIWFPYLLPEYVARKQPEFRERPFIIASAQRGRMVVEAANALSVNKGIRAGMVVADCKAIMPELEMVKAEPGRKEKLLQGFAEWCIGYTPFVAIDFPDGLILDTQGCTHLWGGEMEYLKSISKKLGSYGYTIKTAIADTIGMAWAMARFEDALSVIKPGGQYEAIKQLPPPALRLDAEILTKLKKLGLDRIDRFIDMPHSALRRRFGPLLPLRIGQALGQEIEFAIPIKPIEPYQERLCSSESIVSATGISIALKRLLEALCVRFETESMGLRYAIFKAYRVDGGIQQIEIGTVHPSRNVNHIFRLFEHKIATFEPELGFELFVLEAQKVEAMTEEQSAIWNAASHSNVKIAELLDRVSAKTSSDAISRYVPAERYWPERSIKKAVPLWEKPAMPWRTDLPRPIHLLPKPEPIEVTVVLPDYPPLRFRYKGKFHTVAKSDGPERIEQEWWLADDLYRDYYGVEDENGARYWLFRAGPYDAGKPEWFIHGFFA